MQLGEFTNRLQQAADKSLAVGDMGYVRDWTSHVFRRGSAADILQAKGVEAMLKHGGWRSEQSAVNYVSADELATERLRAACAAMIELSDDDA